MLSRLVLLFALYIAIAAAYVLPQQSLTRISRSNILRSRSSSSSLLFARERNRRENDATLMINLPAGMEGNFVVGENLPEEVKGKSNIYDMILVERFSQPAKTDVGLFIPKTEGRDKKLVGKVLEVPASYGLESEQGRIQPLSEIAPIKVGDMVLLQVIHRLHSLCYCWWGC